MFRKRIERHFRDAWDDEEFPPDFPPDFLRGRARRRVFERGDMKFVLLELLQERPMHGYEMIKALEAQSGGRYAPSPGSIYPTLQLLEDRGWTTVTEVDGKKVYQITEAGRAVLAERQDRDEPPAPHFDRRRSWREHGIEIRALRTEIREVIDLLGLTVRVAVQDPSKLAQLHTIITQTRSSLTSILYGSSAASAPESSSTGGSEGSPLPHP